MKKITLKLLSILTIFIFVFSSCAKDRTCVCTDEDGDKTEVEYEKETKKWMKNSAACVSKTETEDGIYYDYYIDAFGNFIETETPYTITTEYDCKIN